MGAVYRMIQHYLKRAEPRQYTDEVRKLRHLTQSLLILWAFSIALQIGFTGELQIQATLMMFACYFISVSCVLAYTHWWHVSSYFLVGHMLFLATAVAWVHQNIGATLLLLVPILLTTFFFHARAILLVTLYCVGVGATLLVAGGAADFQLVASVFFVGVTGAVSVMNKIYLEESLASLHQTQVWLSALFEQSTDAVFIMNLQGKPIRANQHAAIMLGYTPEELQSLEYHQAVPPEELEHGADVIRRVLQGEAVPPYERTFIRKDGTRFPVEVNIEMVRDENGKPLHVQSLVRDITWRKQKEKRELESALERARVTLLTRFIENASHEFRTPLSVIGSASYLMSRSDDASKRQEKAELVQSQINRITQLVDSLVLMATLEEDTAHFSDTVDLGQVIHALCDTTRVFEKVRHVTCDIAPMLPMIEGYTTPLYTALRQVLDNAIRYTPAEGSITICAYLCADGTHVCVEVEDTGIGIAEADLPKVFNTFWRKDAAHSTPGFGLGLSIAQGIIEKQHGGQITITSHLGQGTKVTIRLPLALHDKAR